MSADSSNGKMEFGPRRGYYFEIDSKNAGGILDEETLSKYEDYDLLYRTLCGVLYNFVPKSGHPGGSISSGRMVSSVLFSAMDYRIDDPQCEEADLISYAAGHKAMGLYAMWALRNECARAANPDMLPEPKHQLRLEDLLGFRRNPTQETPLFKKYNAKALDGHPTPITPFVKLSTGASGVGIPTSFGLAFGAMDYWGKDSPMIHVIEGEGGMTPGRVSEGLASAASAQLWNIVLHVDWNQSSIDSDKVCREGSTPGDYVQWTPAEFCYVHDWNVISVEDGKDFRQIHAALKYASDHMNNQPTAIIYRTVKGWKYGIEGRKSHGAGHNFCSLEYFDTLKPAEERFGIEFPRNVCTHEPVEVEKNFHKTLMTYRKILEDNQELAGYFAGCLEDAAKRLEKNSRSRRTSSNLGLIYSDKIKYDDVPDECSFEPGSSQTLRAALGLTLGYLNKQTDGAFIGASADLLGSTSINKLNADFPDGFYNSVSNPDSRLIAAGGICEDAMGGLMAGISTYGKAVGAGSSYGAFITSLQHITARLHGIGQQAKEAYLGEPYNTWILVNAHAGLKTGEDGPTHADPQCLQEIQENFPSGVLITLTPWDPNEMYPMVIAGLKKRPAVLAPFVTRPSETIIDREKMNLPPVTEAVKGVYAMRKADPSLEHYHGTLVLQGSGVTNTFVSEVLPRIDDAGYNMNIYYISSAELFSMLPDEEQEEIFPEELTREAMAITGLTLPTMYRWVTTREGRQRSIHAFKHGRYLGSGKAHKVFEEANLHGEGQWKSVKDYAEWIESSDDVGM